MKIATAVSSAYTRNLYVLSNGPRLAGTPGKRWNGPIGMGSMGSMPLTPFVRLKPLTSSPFLKISGMISPKPRVTSAR